MEEEQEELDKKRVEEFKKLKTSTTNPNTSPTDTETENVQPANTQAVTTQRLEPDEMAQNTAKRNVSPPVQNMPTVEGGSSVNTLTGTLCNTDRVTGYETNKEEFKPANTQAVTTQRLEPDEIAQNTAKRNVSPPVQDMTTVEGGSSVNTLTGTCRQTDQHNQSEQE